MNRFGVVKKSKYNIDGMLIGTEDPHIKMRNYFKWGTYGKSGTDPYKQVLLKDMSNEHIQAIIDTQFHLTEGEIIIFETELSYRYESNCNIYEGGDE